MESRIVLCVAALALSCANAQQPASLSGLVRSALERNRELQSLRRRVEEAQALLRQAGVRLVPTIEIEAATGGPLGTRGEEEYSAGFFYPFETAGKRAKRIAVATQSVALAQAELDDRARQIVYDIKTRFAEASAEQQRTAALERILSGTRESLRLTEARVAEGDAAPLETKLLQVDFNRTAAQRAGAAGRAQAIALELEALTGVALSQTQLDGAPAAAPGLSLEDLKRRALDTRPDLRIARVLEQQGTAEVMLAEAQARPDVTLSARYAQRHSRFDQLGLNAAGQPVALRDRDNIVSFGVSVPLTRRSRNLGNIEAASARVAGARLRREHLERTVPLEVEAAWRRWDAARRAAELLDTGVVRQSERNLEVVRQAQALGQLRMLDVLNEQRRVIDTEMARIDAATEAARAWAELERAVGGELQ